MNVCTKTIYPPFPNKWERVLILLMQNEKIITFDSQNVFSNNLSFKKAMKNLHDMKIVVWRTNGRNEYKLTDFGEDVANILRFITE